MTCLQRGTAIIALGGLLLACGQKGPLVLPDAPKHKRSVPPLASPVKPNSNGGAPSAPNPAPNSNSVPSSTPAGSAPPPASSFNGNGPAALTRRS